MFESKRLLPQVAAVGSVVALCCGTGTASNDGGSAAPETGSDASGMSDATGGEDWGGGRGGASGSAGAGGTAGSAGQTGGKAGAGGSTDGGGTAGSGGAGPADSAVRDADVARDVSDASHDGSSPDRDADAQSDVAADSADARDASSPPADGPIECTPFPNSGLYATFRVVNDVFYASITNPPGIDQALALWRGQSQAQIPVGQLECNNGTYNCGWTWRMNPASITFAEITIEVCDATPSYVQGNCSSFPAGQYCPWSAQLIALRDCRTDVACPPVQR